MLQQPHPAMTGRAVVLTAFVLGLCISLLLAVFQPFGLYTVPGGIGKTLVIGGYGVVSFLVVLALSLGLPALLPGLYRKEKWTLGKDLLLGGLINFFMVGLCNLLYSMWVFQFRISFQTFLFFQLVTLCVGFLPFAVMMLLRHIQLLNRNMKAAGSLNTSLKTFQEEEAAAPKEPTETTNELIEITGETGNDSLKISAAAFVYAEAADNYIKIWYEENGGRKMKMLRLPMKGLEAYFAHHAQVLRCHRRYMVNIDHVVSFSGNAQGLKLEIGQDAAQRIPVSRAMVPVIKGLLMATG